MHVKISPLPSFPKRGTRVKPKSLPLEKGEEEGFKIGNNLPLAFDFFMFLVV